MRSKTLAHRLKRPDLNYLYQCWSMGFVAQQLFDGKKFRVLTIVDNFSRFFYANAVGQSLKGYNAVEVLNKL